MIPPTEESRERKASSVGLSAPLFRALTFVAYVGAMFPLVMLVTGSVRLEESYGISRYVWVALGSLVSSCLFYPVGLAIRRGHSRASELPPLPASRVVLIWLGTLAAVLLWSVLVLGGDAGSL